MSDQASKRATIPPRIVWIVALTAACLAVLPVLAAVRVQFAFEGLIPDPAVGHVSPAGAVVAGFSGLFGDDFIAVLVGLLTAWLIVRGQTREAGFAVTALLLADFLGRLVKNIAVAPRPYLLGDEGYQVAGLPRWLVPLLVAGFVAVAVVPRWRRPALTAAIAVGGVAAALVALQVVLPERPGLDGFPSGHAKGSMAFAAVAVIIAWPSRLRVLAILNGAAIVAGVALSRIYLDAHYPADVVAGWLVALAAVGLSWCAMLAVERRQSRQLAPSPATGTLTGT